MVVTDVNTCDLPLSFVNSGNYKLHWEEGPRTILIIKKPNDDLTDKALVDVASYVEIKEFCDRYVP